MSVYRLKSGFQNILRPLVRVLASAGVTANQVTIFAVVGSVLVGAAAILAGDYRWFLLIPVWFFIRMALNAVDGMLAREHDQKSVLGAYLNELCDVVSDAALYAPFAIVHPFGPMAIAAIIFLSTLTEFAGVLGVMVGGSRRYDGPLGKSDRAVLFGALGYWVGLGGSLPDWTAWLSVVVCLILFLTIVNRIRQGMREVSGGAAENRRIV